MARIRSIKPEFWTSEQVLDCSPMARLLFIGIWNFCDDAGNHVASPRTIKANVLPGDDIDSATVRGMLDELYQNGLIDFYAVENKQYLHVTGWHHQRIDKPTYKHPEYKPGENDERSLAARRLFDESSPPEWSGEDRSGIGKEKEAAATPPPRACAPAPAHENPPPAAPPDAPEIPVEPPEPPATIPDEAPRRATQIAVLLRRNGADPRTLPNDRRIADWARDGVTDAEVLLALETAKARRQAQGSDQPIGTAYLAPIIADLRASPAEAQAGGKPAAAPQDQWWRSDAGIDRKARELGMFARATEDYASFKDRIFEEIRRRESQGEQA